MPRRGQSPSHDRGPGSDRQRAGAPGAPSSSTTPPVPQRGRRLLGVVAEVRRRDVLVQQRDGVTGTGVSLAGPPWGRRCKADEQVLAEQPLPRARATQSVEQEVESRGARRRSGPHRSLPAWHRHRGYLASATRRSHRDDCRSSARTRLSFRPGGQGFPTGRRVAGGASRSSPGAGHGSRGAWGWCLRPAVGHLDAETVVSDEGTDADGVPACTGALVTTSLTRSCAISSRSSRCAAVRASRTNLRAAATLDGCARSRQGGGAVGPDDQSQGCRDRPSFGAPTHLEASARCGAALLVQRRRLLRRLSSKSASWSADLVGGGERRSTQPLPRADLPEVAPVCGAAACSGPIRQ